MWTPGRSAKVSWNQRALYHLKSYLGKLHQIFILSEETSTDTLVFGIACSSPPSLQTERTHLNQWRNMYLTSTIETSENLVLRRQAWRAWTESGAVLDLFIFSVAEYLYNFQNDILVTSRICWKEKRGCTRKEPGEWKFACDRAERGIKECRSPSKGRPQVRKSRTLLWSCFPHWFLQRVSNNTKGLFQYTDPDKCHLNY